MTSNAPAGAARCPSALRPESSTGTLDHVMVRGVERRRIVADRPDRELEDTGDVAKYVKLYREALARMPCRRVAPQSCLGDSLSPKSDGPRLLRRESASSVPGQSGVFLDIT
jgi:hypothetical protein